MITLSLRHISSENSLYRIASHRTYADLFTVNDLSGSNRFTLPGDPHRGVTVTLGRTVDTGSCTHPYGNVLVAGDAGSLGPIRALAHMCYMAKQISFRL